jgi:undecaprenyl-diphosphatase
LSRVARIILVILLLLWIQLIGFSRVYLKVHYPTDVMAGYAFGFLWLVLSIWMLDKMEKYSRRKVDPVVKEPPQPVTN